MNVGNVYADGWGGGRGGGNRGSLGSGLGTVNNDVEDWVH